jgi:hypothetical protein
MHGLIFETSICYWQDQPGSYCVVRKDHSPLSIPPLASLSLPWRKREKNQRKRKWKAALFIRRKLLLSPKESPLQSLVSPPISVNLFVRQKSTKLKLQFVINEQACAHAHSSDSLFGFLVLSLDQWLFKMQRDMLEEESILLDSTQPTYKRSCKH